jgi:hypothetical protein
MSPFQNKEFVVSGVPPPTMVAMFDNLIVAQLSLNCLNLKVGTLG